MTQLSIEDIKTLTNLEESLWIPKTRFNKEYMKNTLADGFFEYGRSGKIYDRETSINVDYQEFKATLPLKDFSIHVVGDGVVLTTYISEAWFDEVEKANRSSVWVNQNGKWQLRFHQGTPF